MNSLHVSKCTCLYIMASVCLFMHARMNVRNPDPKGRPSPERALKSARTEGPAARRFRNFNSSLPESLPSKLEAKSYMHKPTYITYISICIYTCIHVYVSSLISNLALCRVCVSAAIAQLVNDDLIVCSTQPKQRIFAKVMSSSICSLTAPTSWSVSVPYLTVFLHKF